MDPSSHNLKLNKFKAPSAEVPLKSAPERRARRRSGKSRRDNEGNGSSNSLNDDEPAYMKNEQKLEDRSRKLTWCFIALVASITCLSPFQSLHLTQRVGLLLFESDIIQLQASLFSVIICLIILVILYLVIFLHLKFFKSSQIDVKPKTRRVGGGGSGLILQRLYKQLIGLLAIISAISYLSLALLVPHIRQIQRMPIATFDCNANLITIENCHQQFTTRGGEQSLLDALGQLLFGYGSAGHSDRLIKKFNCFQYQDEELGSPKVPTRFLLHHCGLVCRPQRQQLHQFSDDLNREQQQPEAADERAKARLVPPYHHAVKDTMKQMELGEPETGFDGTHLVYHNTTSSQSSIYHPADHQQQQQQEEVPRQVSLRVCFSSDFSSGSSYKQFCITNLAANTASDHHGGQGGHTLTVGQLNAMLRKFAPADNNNAEPIMGSTQTGREDSSRVMNGYEERSKPRSDDDQPLTKSKLQVEDQTTHYVNPIVQFESHFRNWPHLSTSGTSPGSTRGTSTSDGDSDDNNGGGWCKFRPIPPFIVNNKPFSDIQCSLEHEYTMTTTSPSLLSADESDVDKKMAERIYLKKSPASDLGQSDGDSTSGGEGFLRDRCNIQCKVNILYQIQAGKSGATNQGASLDHTGVHHQQQQHFYLPLKPCIIVSGNGDKLQTSNYYLLFRSLGDATLVMAFILLDLYLLFEAIDSKKSQFESKKYRLTGILLVLTITPLALALLFDLISTYSPVYSATRPTKSDNYLSAFLFDRLLPSLVDLIYSRPSSSISNGHSNNNNNNNQIKRKQSSDGIRQNLTAMNATQSSLYQDTSSTFINFDNLTLPFFVYSVLMFILAINSWTLPVVPSTAPLIRASSAEELGMSNVVGSSCSINNIEPQNGRQLGKQTTGSTVKLNSNDDNNLKLEVAQGSSSRQLGEHKSNKQAMKLISFLLIASFMGIQFNLSQHIQVQILVETFGNPAAQTGGGGGNDFTVTWFVLGTQSTAAIFVLSLVLIFANETSTFFSNSFPLFNLTSKPIDGDDYDGPKQRQSNKFLKYIALAQIIYSLRYFALLSLNSASRFKWMMVFLIQVAEMINFPIVWFALTSRVHELITEHPAGSSTRSARPLDSRVVDQASRTLALNLHIVGQSSLALIYYGLSRYLALFVHSVYLSLHLHSDNVDWFINGFYHQRRAQMSGEHLSNTNNNGTRLNEDVIDAPEVGVPESLFSPLPSERQTYLHASRLFLKYNSILCLIIGFCLLLNRLYQTYRVWSLRMIQQRRVGKSKHNHQVEPKLNEDSSSSQQIDERLSLDLMRIHHQSNNTIYVPPRSPVVHDEKDSERADWRNPRAKILFHYNLGHKDSSDESLSSTTELSSPTRGTDGPQGSINHNHQPQRDELRIPIALAEEEEEEDFENRHEDDLSDGRHPSPLIDENLTRHEATGSTGQVLERVIKHRNKRVRIFEDDEEWPVEISPRVTPDVVSDSSDGNGRQRQEVVSPVMDKRPYASSSGIANGRPGTNRRPTEVSHVPSSSSPPNSTEFLNNRRRTITFAPTATLIGHDGTRGRQLNVSVATRDMGGLQAHPQRASPEPSIDSDDQEGESDGTIN